MVGGPVDLQPVDVLGLLPLGAHRIAQRSAGGAAQVRARRAPGDPVALEPGHPDYEEPGAGEDGCFHPGMLRFAGISKLSLDRRDIGDEGKRRFAIDTFNIEGTKFDMACEWGDIHLQARSIRVLTE